MGKATTFSSTGFLAGNFWTINSMIHFNSMINWLNLGELRYFWPVMDWTMGYPPRKTWKMISNFLGVGVKMLLAKNELRLMQKTSQDYLSIPRLYSLRFLLIDICSHEHYFSTEKTVRCTMALGCTGRVSCVWEDDAPNFWWTGAGVWDLFIL